MLNRLLKVLHEFGAVGVTGSFAACLVLIATAPTDSLVAYAAVRQGIAAITHYLLMPALGMVLVSGLLAIAANRAYQSAGWAWLKALLGISMFEGTLLTVGASARRAADLAAQAAAAPGHPAAPTHLVARDWDGLWFLLALALANIVIAVWRPRFGRSSGD